MKPLKKLILVILIFINISFVSSQNGTVKIEFEACIDGKSLLCLQDDKMWWEHLSYDPPGTHASCNNETSVDGRSWKDWKKPFNLKFSLNNDSLVFAEKLSSHSCCIKMRP